jgi:hypothetical protein
VTIVKKKKMVKPTRQVSAARQCSEKSKRLEQKALPENVVKMSTTTLSESPSSQRAVWRNGGGKCGFEK